MATRYVAVVGPSASSLAARPDRDDVLAAVHEVGLLLAERGAVVLCAAAGPA